MTYIPPEVIEEKVLEIYEEIKDRYDELKNKDKLKIPTVEMPAQDPHVRAHNLEEVAIGYTLEEAIVELDGDCQEADLYAVHEMTDLLCNLIKILKHEKTKQLILVKYGTIQTSFYCFR